MAYTKQNFTNGNVLDATQLNAIEDGIVAVHNALEQKQPKGNYVKTVNGNAPDVNGNVSVEFSSTNSNSNFVAQDTVPEDTSVLWIDTSDKSNEDQFSGQNVAQDYYLLKSPNGTVYKVIVTDGGTLQVVGEASGDETPDDMLTGRLLVWSDEFDGTEVDSSKWLFRMDNPKYVNTASVSNGVLSMPLKYNEETSLWECHYLHSSGCMDAKYGRFEARMKWDVGCFPAFWLVGQTSQKYNGVTEGIIWPRAGEIDVMEDMGTGTVFSTLHWGEVEGAGATDYESQQICRSNELDVTEWHTYGLEWSDKSMTFYYDGKTIKTYDTSSIVYEDGTKPFQLPFYIILDNVSCSNSVPGKTYNCYVDWVRYYAPASVTELIPIESIRLSESQVNLNPGRTKEIGLTITPDYVTDYTMRWYSEDPTIAKFYAGNRITALKAGDVVLYVETRDGLRASCNLHVAADVKNNVTGIALDYGTQAEGFVGETLTIKATVSPKWATYLDCDWESSDTSVATVENGIVTFVGGGNVTITAKAKDNSGVSQSVDLVSIASMTDNINMDGCVVKYTRKGWNADGWQSDIAENTTLPVAFQQGSGYYYSSMNSNANAYTDVGIDTAGDFTVAIRVHQTQDGVPSGGSFWQIANPEVVPSGTTMNESCVVCGFEGNGKMTLRAYKADKTFSINKYQGFDCYSGDIADNKLTKALNQNVIVTHSADGTWVVYYNGVAFTSVTDASPAETIANAVLCLGAYPQKTRQCTTDFFYQALLAYNKALTAEEVSALNTALDEMYA